QYERAIEQARRTLLIDPQFVGALCLLGWCYEQQGLYDMAIEQLRQAADISGLPEVKAMVGHAYAVAGRVNESRAVLDELLAQSGQRYVTPYYTAVICAGLGDADEAFAWLERAFHERDEWLLHLKVDPKLDPLREDTRFAELLRRIEL
ncbi:MAG: tetratricopeptide repeat protein, partial [Acidobacteria bacterium]|nr:tetratricopeptide repeat protein [Acidobacteriota bacterium]